MTNVIRTISDIVWVELTLDLKNIVGENLRKVV